MLILSPLLLVTAWQAVLYLLMHGQHDMLQNNGMNISEVTSATCNMLCATQRQGHYPGAKLWSLFAVCYVFVAPVQPLVWSQLAGVAYLSAPALLCN